jgi:hypothetical protein
MIYSFSNTTSYSTFYAFFSDNIMADVASKQQTKALFLSTIVTRTRRHIELTKETDKPDRKLVQCQRTINSVFGAIIFYPVKLHSRDPLEVSHRFFLQLLKKYFFTSHDLLQLECRASFFDYPVFV